MDIESPKRFAVHRQILDRKKVMKQVFQEFHNALLAAAQRNLSGKGIDVEIGSGVFPLKESNSKIISSDLVAAPHLDMTLDAQNMSFDSSTVATIYGQNCFHHFPEPDRFFAEVQRVTVPGGGVVLIEPHFGPLAAFIYKRLFAFEGYDRSADHHRYLNGPAGQIPNQALSYIYFIKDRSQFEAKFPELQILSYEVQTNWLRYLLCGGLNFRQLYPNFLGPVISLIEILLKPLKYFLGLHTLWVIRKRVA